MENNAEMKKSQLCDRLVVVMIILARLVVGATFIFSGFVKAVDPTGSAIKFTDYFTSFGLGFLSPLSLFFAVILSAFEFVIGINMFLGSYRKMTSWLVFLTMCFMTPLTLYLAIANPVSDCGCFGDALVLTNWETFIKNVVLFALSVFLLRKNSCVRGLYNRSVQWLANLYTILFALMLSWFGIYYQPVLDFRPYKSGVNITKDMQVDGEDTADEYVFIYEKDGQRKEFSLDNYPADDTTWVFVDRVEKSRNAAASEPKIKDFTIYEGSDDVTHTILDDPRYTFLIMLPSLKDADDSDIDKINELYDYASAYGYNFYGITSSSPLEIAEWQDNTGAEYPFYSMDETTIKTIIRGNPGVVLLKEGTILWKRLPSHLPDETYLNAPLDKMFLGTPSHYDVQKRVGLLAFIYGVPMLILLLTEKTVAAIIAKIKKRRNLKKAVENTEAEL